MNNESSPLKILPVLCGFFVMGFVDVVGIATNYVKMDFSLSDSLANLLPMIVFLWFAIFSIPTSLMMNKIGRKKTVIVSMIVTAFAMLIPLLVYQFSVMLIAFALLGIGNTILQVSLNPLLTNVVSGERLTSSLTLGQFIKAIASFLGPIIVGFAVITIGNWKFLFPLFGAITLISATWLFFTTIEEKPVEGRTSSFSDCFSLLKDKRIFLLFLGILFVVGVDVGLNTTVPKLLMERCNILLKEAGLGTSLYFAARTIGTFIGAILLVKLSGRKFFIVSMIVAIAAMFVMLMASNLWTMLGLVFILGLSVANVFSIIFSAALQLKPERANEISGLMIMGVAGGAILPPIMGLLSDLMGQTGGLFVLLVALIYLLGCAYSLKSIEQPNKNTI
jgi:MFS transporter, FHS family, L-fucose permease